MEFFLCVLFAAIFLLNIFNDVAEEGIIASLL